MSLFLRLRGGLKDKSQMEIKLKDLLEAGCHFGHQVTRWNPKMKPYLFAARDRIHIFDLAKTKEGLDRAMDFVREVTAKDGKIVFVGTKRQAQEIIKEAAIQAKMPYVSERWIGGTLTNWERIKKNIDTLAELKLNKAQGKYQDYTKKENLLIDRKISRLEHVFGGLAELKGLPAALFIVDLKKESGAAKEARAVGVKVIALVDSNSDPDLADFVIPANDDAVKSVQFIVGAIKEAVLEAGKKGKKAVPSSEPESALIEKEEKPEEKSKIKKVKKEKTIIKTEKETEKIKEAKEKEEKK